MKTTPHFRATGTRRQAVCWLTAIVLTTTVLCATRTVALADKRPTLKNLHDAVAAEKYHEARQIANGLLQSGDPAVRGQVARPLGRIMLATGDTAGVEAYFKTLKKAKLDEGAQELIKVYQLWKKALDGKTDEAIAGLQAITKLDKPTYGALEAADILAILQLQRDQREAAQKTVDAALQVIQYNSFKDPYIERLLRGRMSSKWFVGGGEAERLYNEAEALRKNEKFADAGKLYAQVQATYPENVFADASGFRIGQCFVGLGQPQRAETHWRGFIDAKPKGPWRGQALAALAEDALINRLDFDSATEHLRAAANTFELGVDETALPSWRQAATDFYLQQGMLAIARRQYPDGVTSLANAWRQRGHGHAQVAKSIERFQEIAGEQADVLPGELYQSDSEAQAANGVGKLMVMMERYDDARKIFTALIEGSKASRSAPHRSYAAVELARIYFREEEYDQAKNGYQYSLSQHDKAAWHDETLRELALLIERVAREKYRSVLAGLKKESQGKLSAKAKRVPSDAYLKARAEAVPYWVGIFQKFPDSPHMPQALFHMGQLYVEAGKFEWAATSFRKLTADYPQSAWTGDAHVWLLDVKLEREYDLAGAREHARDAMQWLAQLDREVIEQTRDAIIGSETAGLRTLRGVTYDIYVRAGLIEYLDQQYATAAQRFQEAQRYAPSRDFEVAFGEIPTGIERLIRAARSGESITPETVLDGDSKARLMLMLADLYHEGQQHFDGLQLCDRVVNGLAPEATDEQRSYAFFRRGRCHFSIEGEERDIDQAYGDYMAAVKLAPETDWADKALFLAANMHWNFHRDADGAVRLWRRLIETYPKSDEAPRAAYYVGVAYEWSGQLDKARAAYHDALAEYPQSMFNSAVRSRMTGVDTELDRQEEGKHRSPTSANSMARPAADGQ